MTAAGEGRAPRVRIIQTARQWGGVEHNNTQLALHLARRGIPVTITAIGVNTYSRMPRRYAEALEVEEIPWPRDPYDFPPTFRDWYRILRARPADVAVFPKSWWRKGGLAMMAAARLAYRRVVVREEGAPIIPARSSKRHLGGILPGLQLWYYRHLAYGRLLSAVPARIICVSEITRDRLVQDCGYPASRTVTVHNAVDCEVFRYDPAARDEYRRRCGIPAEATVLGAVGRIDNIHKRHDLSLRLFARLLAERPDDSLYFLLVGEGPDRQAMEALARELGVQDRVVFGPFTSTPWEAHSALDVFLMPSCSESFGIALIEAMACGRCVIGSAIEGIAEILNEEGIGFSFPLEDDEALYVAMRGAVAMGPEGRRSMGERARRSVERRFGADQQYGRVIEHVLGTA